jgi:hypothetical protein
MDGENLQTLTDFGLDLPDDVGVGGPRTGNAWRHDGTRFRDHTLLSVRQLGRAQL